MTSEVPQPVVASTYPDDLRGLVDSYLATLRFSAIPETAGIEEAMSRRDELRALGHERAAAFSWDETARRTVEVYREASQ